MPGQKIHIKSFGCQMNKLDTALVVTALKKVGFVLVDGEKEADVVLINTCSVREHAEEKVFSHLGNLKHIKQSHPDLVVGVIGCMAQRVGEQLLEHSAVDIVCGPAQIPQIVGLVNQAVEKNGKLISITDKIRQPDEKQSSRLEEFESVFDTDGKAMPSQVFVRAMRGCNNFCTYCVVPYVRGPEISRPPKAIIEQIKRLAGQGVKVVTLLGQTINSYEYHNGEKTCCLADLLEMANEVEGIEWIRFVTSYPSEKYFDEICHAMADLPKVCKYLHMPAQSGSDKILKAMNRHYSASQYLNLLDKARDIVGGIGLSGDFIVGFPSETEEDFQASVELLQKARYKNAFIFKYSPRPGTNADKRLADNIALEIKKQRNNELLKALEEISTELSKEFLNKEVKVFVEGLSKKPHLNKTANNNHPQLTARTTKDWIVVFNGSTSLIGQFVNVKITKTRPLTLFGELTLP